MGFGVLVQSPLVLLIWACDVVAHDGWSAWWRTARRMVAARAQKEEAGNQIAP